MNQAADPTPTTVEVRVFLASSRDLADERRAFDAMIMRIAARPNMARGCRLVPVTWQSDGGPVEGQGDLQQAIFKNAGFDAAHVILVLVGRRVGPGTLAEYERALELRRRHGSWPALLMFFQADSDGTTLSGGAPVQAFHEKVIADASCVPTNFRNTQELEQRLTSQLEDLLLGSARYDHAIATSARSAFNATALAIGATCLVSLWAAQTMAFPDNAVAYWKVMVILAAPPLLFVLGSVATWQYQRLIVSFRGAWRSAQHARQDLLADFAKVIPVRAWPRTGAAEDQHHSVGDGLVALLLALVFVLPPVVQHGCLFAEFLSWQFVVAPDRLAPDSTSPQDSRRGHPVSSRFVQRGPLPFPYVATDPGFRQQQKDDGVVFVYAPGFLGDGSKFGLADAFRENIGPEVFLPWQPLAYLALWIVQLGYAAYAAALLAGLRRSLRPSLTRAAHVQGGGSRSAG